jgi:hypothetical protein
VVSMKNKGGFFWQGSIPCAVAVAFVMVTKTRTKILVLSHVDACENVLREFFREFDETWEVMPKRHARH